MKPLVLFVSLFILSGIIPAVNAIEMPVTPFVRMLAPVFPGDPQQPDQLSWPMWEHARKILREFDDRHRFGSDRGLYVGFGENALRKATRELDEHSFIVALAYIVADPENAEVNVRLRIYDAQNYLKYEYNFYDIFHADGECIQAIAAMIANYPKDPRQFEVLNEAGEDAEELDMSDYTALDLSEFTEGAEAPPASSPVPAAPTAPPAPSPAEIAAREKRLTKLRQELAECEQEIAASPDDIASRYSRLHILSQIARQHPWEERIPLWEQLLAECDAYIRYPGSDRNLMPVYSPTLFFPGLEVTPEALPLSPEWQERRDRFFAAFRNLSITENISRIRTAMPGLDAGILPAFEAMAQGTLAMQPACYWNYERMQQERHAALNAFLQTADAWLRQHPQENTDLNQLLMGTFGSVLDPTFGTCPWSGEFADVYRYFWSGDNGFRNLPLPFVRTLEHQRLLILKWADPERTDFAEFTRDYAAMLAAVRRDDPEWFAPGTEQSSPYLNGEGILLLEPFVKVRFPREAADFLTQQKEQYRSKNQWK